MKLLTAKLTGKALDWALAKALGAKKIICSYKGVWVEDEGFKVGDDSRGWIHHTDPALWSSFLGTDRGQVFEIKCRSDHEDKPYFTATCWRKSIWRPIEQYGSTSAEAVCRCIVQVNLGERVEVPDELCEQRKEGA